MNQAEARRLFDYDPETGALTWRVRTGPRTPVGDEAGHLTDKGYRRVRVHGRLHLAHRIIWLWMTGDWPAGEIDHVNHVRDDNRWTNLREATRVENTRNASMRHDNTSGHVGVHWHRQNQKWMARIKVNGKLTYLGTFESKADAIAARQAAEIEHGFHPNHGKKV
jgi:hypothetical protein